VIQALTSFGIIHFHNIADVTFQRYADFLYYFCTNIFIFTKLCYRSKLRGNQSKAQRKNLKSIFRNGCI